jgi:hypothetical protein
MIQSIQLTNFKCFKHQEVVLRPLTLLAGLNSSGKSTIIQAFLLLRQSYLEGLLPKRGLTLNGKLAQLGTAKDILFEEADEDEIGFELKDDLPASLHLRLAYREESDVLALSRFDSTFNTFAPSASAPAHLSECPTTRFATTGKSAPAANSQLTSSHSLVQK